METFNFILYLMAVLTCLACTVLLGRGYMHTGVRLLLWSTLCFVLLTVNNVLLVVDLVVTGPQSSLGELRTGAGLAGLLLLLYGLIYDRSPGRRA
jgi:hypothetical protein